MTTQDKASPHGVTLREEELAFKAYLAECEERMIEPDIAGAFHAGHVAALSRPSAPVAEKPVSALTLDRPVTFGGCPFCGRQDCIAGQCQRAAKPEQQAQAGEPRPVWNFGSDRENENGTVIMTVLGAHHAKPTDQFITLQSHREAMWEGGIRAKAIIDNKNEAIAKKDAALLACVEALENIKDDYAAHDGKRWDIDAAIQQAEEALK